MPRKVEPLTALAVKAALSRPGRYRDGRGLSLRVRAGATPLWTFEFTAPDGRRRELALGSALDVSLAQARVMAQVQRDVLRDGRDPVDERHAARIDAKRARAAALTFGQCCERYIASHRPGWRNAKHADQWSSTLRTYCASFYTLPVADVGDAAVLAALEPIWTAKPETASRVRQRIEAVLDWARARGLRLGENPARLRGHLDVLLPRTSKVKRVVNRAALPYATLPAFVEALRARQGLGARALELQILTATRPGEAAAARWCEIDTAAGVWTIPPERMKAGREHRVPLSAAAFRVLADLPREGEFVFSSLRGKPITTDAAMKVVDALAPGMTAHGFRSTFRDWAAECTGFPREVIEHALAHQLKDKVEAAYFRSDLFAKREKLMDAWAEFIDAPPVSGAEMPIARATA